MQNMEDGNPSVPNQEDAQKFSAKVIALVVVVLIVLGIAVATVPGLRAWVFTMFSFGEQSAHEALLEGANNLGERVAQEGLLTEVEMLDRVNAITTDPLTDTQAQDALNRLENL